MLLWTLREPVIDGGRLRLNSLTGAYSAANALRAFNYHPFRYCFGAPEDCVTVSPAANEQNQISIRLPEPDPVHSRILNGLLLHFQALAEDSDGAFRVTVSGS